MTKQITIELHEVDFEKTFEVSAEFIERWKTETLANEEFEQLAQTILQSLTAEELAQFEQDVVELNERTRDVPTEEFFNYMKQTQGFTEDEFVAYKQEVLKRHATPSTAIDLMRICLGCSLVDAVEDAVI